MEISKHQIARLVLGYLKSEKCKKAFDEFLVKSQYLKSYAVFVKNGKYFATRVGGLTLEDILAEYSDIALMIQGRLEETDYYEKNHKMKLSEQLTYIFDHCSRSVSPVLSNDLNATPVESLPGNSSNIPHTSPVRSEVNTENTTTIGYDESSNVSSVLSPKNERKPPMSELDHKITSLKQKAEKDPAFDKLLEEIIGHKNETPAECTTTRNNLDKNQSNAFVQNCQVPQTPTSKLTVDVSDDYKKQTGAVATKTSDSQHQSQIFMTSTPSLLMVPSLRGPSNYILVNSGPVGNAAPLSTVLTETDIMKMPTVILEGGSSSSQGQMVTVPQHQPGNLPLQMPPERRPVPMTESQIIITSHLQPTTSGAVQKSPTSNCKPVVKKVRTLVPKTDKVTIASSDGDFYRVLNDNLEIPEVDDCENIRTRSGLRKRMAKMAQLRSEAPPSPKAEKKSPEKAQSPPKKAAECNDRKKSRVNKSLFAEGRKMPKDTWDADLRELLIPKSIVDEEKMDVSEQNLDTTCEEECDDEELKKEAKMLEDAFKTPVKPERRPETNQISPVVEEEPKTVPKVEEKPEEASIPTEKPTKTEEQETEEETTVLTVETEVYLRNCNGPPRIKKKCNQTESNEVVEVEIFQETSFEEVKQTKVLTLETPMKAQFPKTPGKFENMTPFSKVLEEQLQGMDLLSLPTPTTTIQTPVFPITPNVALNTPEHASRPTDYSTSSSYYQPSDNEQNKSLETLMEQYKKEEGVEREPVAKRKKEEEIKAMFNKNVIGKKNLSLMKKEEEVSSESESDSSSSEEEEDSASESEAETKKGRKRKVATPKENRSVVKEEKIEVEKCDMENEITDDDFALHLSTDEDSFNKITTKPTKTEEASGIVDETTEEAKQLIQGLYERGIHLLPKVSQDKPSNAPPVRPHVLENPNALENLDVSSEEELNSSKNPEDVTFDCKHYDQKDVISYSYDYSKRKKKKSYDLAVLDRKLEANVYIEALNTEMIRWITFGPTTQVLDYSPKKVTVRRRSVKGTPKPKDMNKIKIKLKTESTNKDSKPSKDTKGPENSTNRSKRLRSSSTEVKSKENTTNKKSNVVPLSKAEIARNKMVEKLMQDEKKSIAESKEDDLMDFAVLGVSSEQKKEEGVTSREKRKLNSEVDVLPPEKKAKTETEKQALLKGINVDVFLNTVHGVSKPS